MDHGVGLGDQDAVFGDVDIAGDFGQVVAVGQLPGTVGAKDQGLARRDLEAGLAGEGLGGLGPQVGQGDGPGHLQVVVGEDDVGRGEAAVEDGDGLVAVAQGLDEDLDVIGHVFEHGLMAAGVLVEGDEVGIAPDVEQGLGRLAQVVADDERSVGDGPK